jgi:Predicted acyltransferase
MTDAAPTRPAIRLSHFSSGAAAFQSARDIRRKVFIEEQHVPVEEEWDALDDIATHVLVTVDAIPAGTARFYPEDGWLKIGRVAVLLPYRGLGLGHALLRYSLEHGDTGEYDRVFLNAQTDKMRFYEKHGFHRIGEEFDEAGIQHIRMERKL